MKELPLPYLIDALVELDNEITARATHARNGLAGTDDWPDQRADWYRAVAPLRTLCMQRIQDELGEKTEDQAERLLCVLVAAARRRLGASISVDIALGL